MARDRGRDRRLDELRTWGARHADARSRERVAGGAHRRNRPADVHAASRSIVSALRFGAWRTGDRDGKARRGRRRLPRILEGIGDDYANQPEESHDAEQRRALTLAIDHATEDLVRASPIEKIITICEPGSRGDVKTNNEPRCIQAAAGLCFGFAKRSVNSAVSLRDNVRLAFAGAIAR
jgi:hypothetical protein